jgi:hypothetical protein
MVTACYIVIYYVTDFPMGEKPVRHEDAYRNYDNALLVAKDLAKCLDVVDDVYVIDGLTGEVLNTILKDAPQENKTEEDNAPTDNTEKNNAPISSGIFDDGTGGVWQLTVDNKWDYQCLGLVCSDCAYCDNSHCVVRSPVTEEERDIQIKSAKARMSETARLSPQR